MERSSPGTRRVEPPWAHCPYCGAATHMIEIQTQGNDRWFTSCAQIRIYHFRGDDDPCCRLWRGALTVRLWSKAVERGKASYEAWQRACWLDAFGPEPLETAVGRSVCELFMPAELAAEMALEPPRTRE